MFKFRQLINLLGPNRDKSLFYGQCFTIGHFPINNYFLPPLSLQNENQNNVSKNIDMSNEEEIVWKSYPHILIYSGRMLILVLVGFLYSHLLSGRWIVVPPELLSILDLIDE